MDKKLLLQISEEVNGSKEERNVLTDFADITDPQTWTVTIDGWTITNGVETPIARTTYQLGIGGGDTPEIEFGSVKFVNTLSKAINYQNAPKIKTKNGVTYLGAINGALAGDSQPHAVNMGVGSQTANFDKIFNGGIGALKLMISNEITPENIVVSCDDANATVKLFRFSELDTASTNAFIIYIIADRLSAVPTITFSLSE